MMRWHACIVVGLFGLAAASWTFQTAQPDIDQAGMTAPETAAFQRQSLEFGARCDGWIKELESGSVSLREVSGRVREYCEVYYPKFLAGLAVVVEGNSHEERIARNLIWAFETEIVLHPDCAPLKATRDRLIAELNGWSGARF